MPRFATLFIALAALAAATSTHAQSDPSNFDTVINVPGDAVPNTIGSNTQLNITDGGAVSVIQPGRFSTPTTPNTIEVNVLGGTVQGIAAYYTTVNISGGDIGVAYAYWGGVYNISGGRISGGGSQQRSTFNISGGVIDGTFATCPETEVNFSGGTLLAPDSIIRISDDSTFRMTGGILGQHFSNYTGGTFELSGGAVGADIDTRGTIYGGEFELNGVPYTDDSISIDSINNPNDIFTGVLADGSPFIFAPSTRDRLREVQLSRVELPAIDLNPILVDTANPTGPYGLRPGQSLTLESGGSLGGNFAAIDSDITVNGGEVGHGMELLRSSLVVNGGTIGTGPLVGDRLHLFNGSELVINDGRVDTHVDVYSGCEVHVHGGTIAKMSLRDGSIAQITGGEVEGQLEVGATTQLSISGGIIDRLTSFSGATLDITGGSFGPFSSMGPGTTLSGGEFKLNGEEYTASTITLAPGDTFTGTLANGSVLLLKRGFGNLNTVSLSPATLPAINTTPIVVDSPTALVPAGLRSGQALTLRDSGVLPSHFAAAHATISIEGGEVMKGIQASGSTISVTGGSVRSLMAVQGSHVRISGGTFGGVTSSPSEQYVSPFAAFDSTAEISGGTFSGLRLTNSITTLRGGTFENTVLISGGVTHLVDGTFGPMIELKDGGQLNISGGQWGHLPASFPDRIRATGTDNQVNLFGTDFVVDGTPLEGLALHEIFEFSSLPRTISGFYPDGTPFYWTIGNRGTLNLYPDTTLTVTLTLPGDFNGDAVVDLADYTVWRDNLGSDNTLPGDLTPGTVTQDDYDLWKSHFGEVFTPTSPVNTAQVPEPATALLLLAGIATSWLAERRAGRRSAIMDNPMMQQHA